jgi:DnaJ-domain-containing protein 1
LLEARRSGTAGQAVAKGGDAAAASGGLFSRLRNTVTAKMDQRTKATKQDQTASLLEFISGLERFNFEVWGEFMKTKMDEHGFSWKSKLPGFNRSFEIEQSKSTLEIISAMSVDERTCKVPIRPESVERIAAASGTSTDQVEQLIQGISQYAQIHRWMRRRTLEGILPPKDLAELRIAMALDRRGNPHKPPRWMRKARFAGGNKGRQKRY